MKTKYLAILFIVSYLFTACGGGGSGSGGEDPNDEEGTTSFPSSLAVASPFDVAENDTAESVSATRSAVLRDSDGAFISRYTWATARIDQILNGDTAELCRFDPQLFLGIDTDAPCYGPTVQYEGHPDAPGEFDRDGQLPSGDVGIWSETDSTVGHACAAAELNARMEGARDKALSSLMGLASLVCVMQVNGITRPHNSTEDLTDEMNALGISDVTFATATITHDDSSGSDQWSYELDFDYTSSVDTHHIVVAMTHIPGGAPLAYRGRLSYRVNNTMTGGNCPAADVTDNGSLLYERTAAEDLQIEVRTGQFCEHDSDGMADGLVDPSNKYNPGSNPTGWANNFNILTADFDPTTMDGDFAYSWQAGPGDGNTRIFNVHVATDATSSEQISDAFFGYGEDIEETDGSIGGFICNWAGPNNSHALQDLAQYQEVTFDGSSGTFVAEESAIVYAPTNACEYDGLGDFSYDTDRDGAVDTDPATAVANELSRLTDGDGDGLFDEIADSGFVAPASPANL